MQQQTTSKDFQMISRLGEGSYSSVYKVKRISDNKIYAFKRVKMNLLNDKEKENALNEVRILASINDPFIIGYKEAFFDEATNSLCIVMEYADQGDLQKLIKSASDCNKHIPEQEIWRCLFHIAKGLKTLHETNILHRDLKCANVFIGNPNVYKLGDMNVSKVAAKGLVYTQTGTPYYASPEVWRDEAYDMKSDIWSLGCVLYEMASWKPPFRANDMQGLFKKVQRGLFERIPKFYSEDLQNIICECLKVQPSLRPSTQQLLNNSMVVKHVKEAENINIELLRENSKAQLLNTIEVPKNLKFLKERLPKPNYQQEKLNSSFEENKKNSKEIAKIVSQRGVSAGNQRNEIHRYQSKETIFQQEIALKLENINKNLENPKEIPSKNSENVEKKPVSRPSSSRNQNKNPINLDIIHSPLPEIQVKNNNMHKYPLRSPVMVANNLKKINELIINNKKSPVISIKSPKINKEIPIAKRPRRPYSHSNLRKKDENQSKIEQIQPQIRMISKPIIHNNSSNNKQYVRPFSGDSYKKNNCNNYENKNIQEKIPQEIKKTNSNKNLHKKNSNNNNNFIIEDALDQLRQEIQQKQQKINSDYNQNIAKNPVKVQRVASANIQKTTNSRKSSKKIEESENILKNKINVYEKKPITAPNVSRAHYKIKLKSNNNEINNYNINKRVAIGQQIVNGNYQIKKKDKKIY